MLIINLCFSETTSFLLYDATYIYKYKNHNVCVFLCVKYEHLA